jgi:adenine C2-methylase RlmN of 23S rRNA A2503 and tRNA A37
MLNLSKKLREQLNETACTELPEVVKQSHALDGVIKWVIDTGKDNFIETVYIPESHAEYTACSFNKGSPIPINTTLDIRLSLSLKYRLAIIT